MIHNWIRKYKEDGYNVINHKKGKPTHERQRQANSRAPKTDYSLASLKTSCLEGINRKIK